ncbi:DNA polymerase III subunit alpha [bacterium]|nr:DNA polymerase III subunit alpha [bacterium]
MAFVHLHLHTIYSFLDGLVKPAELAKKLEKLGMNAVAITDHGNMHGVVDFYTTMIGKDEKGNYNKIENAKIKPIIGMEAYISAHDRTEKVAKDAFHLLLLAENEKGYKNLCYMASEAFVDGFYYKPRIDRALIKEHSEGIIATSACLGGEIPRALVDGRDEDAKRIALEYIELFGKNNFFIELQVNGIKEQEEVNPKLIKLARELGVGLVATNDVHYLSPEAAEAQDILFCINEKKKVTDTDRMHHETAAFYLKSEEEMRNLFSVYGEAGTEAIENTVKIAERCAVELDLGHNYLPIFDTGDKTPAEFLRDMAEKGLEERFLELGTPEEKKQAYRDRLEYELGVIIRMDFPGYFLIVSDFIRWAKNHGIPVGPGRGSGAGSLVAYCTRITDLDPLRYELLFERFLNPERISMPDFDVDFCQDNRERVIEYVEDKYGHENVAQIATFGQLKAKSAIRDVARALDIPLTTADKLAKIVPEAFADMYQPQYLKKTKDTTKKLIEKYNVPADTAADPDKLRKAVESLSIAPEDADEIKSLNAAIDAFANERKVVRDNEDFSRIIKIAVQIEGLLRQPGKHACGLVIGQKPIYEYSPIFVDKDNYHVTQYEKTTVELVGLVKFDFLGLKTLTMINHAVSLIRKKKPDFDISMIPLDDAATYKYICENSTKGIFQMESGGFEKMIHQMKPDRIEDLIAAVALFRPGPMDIIPNYIKRKHGKEKIEYDHPWLSEILSETYGLMVYQEQVMQISRRLAGFSMGQADGLRKAMGKKIAAKMAEAKVKFIEGAKNNGIPEETAKLVFDHMEKFASYGFNKSHAACYGYISYQTAYLKTHYPTEFLTALITSEAGDANKVFMYISDAREHGIKVYLPDVNKSFNSFSIEENAIRYGFGAVKNVGEAAVDEIIREREKNGDFKSLIDFTSRMSQSKVNSRAIEYLIKAGAFDFTGINRGLLLAMLPSALKEGSKAAEDKDNGQLSLFAAFADDVSCGCSSVTDEDLLKQVDKNEAWDVFDSLAFEREVLGIYLSNHPARFFKKDFQNLGLSSIGRVIEDVESGRRFYGQRNDNWVPGIITTEIKPTKSKDGKEYYLKGILESESNSVDFSINKIENALGNPDLAKLSSKVPLIFKVRGKAVMTGDDEEKTLEKVVFSINDLKSDVLTLGQFMQHCRMQDGLFDPMLMYECSEEEFLKNRENLNRMFSDPSSAFSIKLCVKINFGGLKGSVVLEKDVKIDISKLAQYKSVFGYDNLYLKENQ